MKIESFVCGPTQDLDLPRILCLHGGGSTARIYRAQCRSLIAELSPFFTFVFADGPFASEPGPDVTSVYESFGPYRAWLRTGTNGTYSNNTPALDIERALLGAIEDSDRRGHRGPWVAVMGFSQGAKMAGSLLLRQQLHPSNILSTVTNAKFRFGILMAGSGPLVSLTSFIPADPSFLDAVQYAVPMAPHREECIPQAPTIHLHGLKDPGLHRHRALLKEFCPQRTMLLEWDGNHRVPIRTKDVVPLAEAILDMAQATGSL